MVWFLVVFLASFVAVQQVLLVALLNRLLIAVKVPVIEMPKRVVEPVPVEQPRRKVMSVPLFD